MPECGANKRGGGICKSVVVMANGRCRIHGGKTPQGIALPQTTHGRYSKHLPTRLLSTYEAALSDGQLLALRDEIGVLDARLSELIGRVDSGESGWLWGKLKDALEDFREAKAKGDVPGMTARLAQMEEWIDKGIADYAAWGEIQNLIQQRRKVVESERKRLVEMQQMITSERAMILLAAVVDTIRKHVTDPQQLRGISEDIRALVAA